MSNASLREQLEAVASQFQIEPAKKEMPKPKIRHPQKPPHVKQAHHQKPPATTQTQAEKKPPKPRWLDYVHYGIDLLKVYFPNAFRPMRDTKPLKKGIKQDLLMRLSTMDTIVTEDKACMVKSLSYYVNTLSYLKCVMPGSMRVDLDGQPAEAVTEEEAVYSKERYQSKMNNKNNETLSSSLEKIQITE